MQERMTHATVVDPEALTDSFVVTFSRRELEALHESGDPAQLWLELEREGNGGPKRVAIDLTTSDIEQLLQHPNGDDLLIALDGYALNGLFDDGEVEAHGLRTALAIAVVAAGMAAPAGLAATPQTASPAASAQKASPAASVQQASPAARAQVSTAASKVQAAKPAASVQAAKPQAKTQAKPAANVQGVKPAAKAHAAKPAAKVQGVKPASKAQLAKTLKLNASGITLLRRAG